jgi:PTH1 family peptidyl-tRNA hydrolase
MKLFVGLGNPGSAYARHRHNVGFMALERIAERHGLGPWKKRFHGLVCDGPVGGRRVMLLMPQTFMNDSGRSVGEAQRYLKIAEGDIYVFHDEIDLAPGKLRVKTGGGNAGHNGLRSISAHIGNGYARVRVGVGHPGSKEAVVHYVLHDFAKADREWLEPLLDALADAAGRLAAGDDARFLTDVARAVQSKSESESKSGRPRRGEGEARAKLEKDAARPATSRSATAADPAPAAASAGAPQRPGRVGGLAANLRKWLRGRGEGA